MERTVSATEARIHFGELMRRVVEDEEAIIVERAGRPHVVVLSVEEYDRLTSGQVDTEWKAAIERALAVGERIRERRGGKPLDPPPEEVIRKMREERGDELVDLH